MYKNISFYVAPYPEAKTYFDIIDAAAQYGVPAVEGLSSYDLKQPDIEHARRIREYADSKNIKFCCFSVFINLVGKDGADMLERLKGYAKVAKILGSPFLHHTIANDYRNPENVLPYRDVFFKNGVAAAQEIYDYCEQEGMRTLVEEQGYLFNGVKGIQDLLDAASRNIGVVADFGNIYQSEEEIKDFIAAFGNRIAHVHIKDVTLTDTNLNGCGLKTINGRYMNAAEIGSGSVGVRQAIGQLKAFNYDGYYAIEHTVQKNKLGNMLKSIDGWIKGE